VLIRPHKRSTTRTRLKNSLSPLRYFTEHLVGVFGKLPWENNLDHNPRDSRYGDSKAHLEFNLQQISHNGDDETAHKHFVEHLACTNRNAKNRSKNCESRSRLTTAHVNLGDKNTTNSATKNPNAKHFPVARPALEIGAQRASLNSEPRAQPSTGANGESREQLLPTEKEISARKTASSKKNQLEHWPLARRLKRTKKIRTERRTRQRLKRRNQVGVQTAIREQLTRETKEQGKTAGYTHDSREKKN
jgi:hypothetical protein